jgi:hypothetical protein
MDGYPNLLGRASCQDRAQCRDWTEVRVHEEHFAIVRKCGYL